MVWTSREEEETQKEELERQKGGEKEEAQELQRQKGEEKERQSFGLGWLRLRFGL